MQYVKGFFFFEKEKSFSSSLSIFWYFFFFFWWNPSETILEFSIRSFLKISIRSSFRILNEKFCQKHNFLLKNFLSKVFLEFSIKSFLRIFTIRCFLRIFIIKIFLGIVHYQVLHCTLIILHLKFSPNFLMLSNFYF